MSAASSNLVIRILSFLVVLGSVVGMVVVPNPLSAAPGEQRFYREMPHTDVNPLGANFFLEREVETWKRDLTLKMAKEAGIGWARIMFSWEEIEPRKGYFWDDKYKASTWQKYDEIVDLAAKYGIRIIAGLDRSPAWARKGVASGNTPPDDFRDFGDFVYAVASRYRGKVHHYQIWNEPNIWPNWGDQPPDPKGYVEMLKETYQRAKEADSNALVLSAPLAQTLEKSSRNLSELDYLEEMYRSGAQAYFDILCANAYGFDRPPGDPPDPNTLNFARVMLLREIMLRRGDDGKAVWLNEFGWNASPLEFPPDRLAWSRVSEEQQANYTVEAISLARSLGWIGVINLWYFRQVGDIPVTRSEYFFRMVDLDFTPRLVYHRVKEMGTSLRVAPPGHHHETSPAVEALGRWSLISLPDASGGYVISTSDPGQILTFTFRGTDVALAAHTGSKGGRLKVTVDGESSSNLGKGRGDSVYLNLESLQDEGIKWIPVVSALRPGVHTLRLETLGAGTGSAEGQWLIDAFDVSHQPRTGLFYAFSMAGALGLLTLILSFLLGRGHQ